jgi:hypothetical protein
MILLSVNYPDLLTNDPKLIDCFCESSATNLRRIKAEGAAAAGTHHETKP